MWIKLVGAVLQSVHVPILIYGHTGNESTDWMVIELYQALDGKLEISLETSGDPPSGSSGWGK